MSIDLDSITVSAFSDEISPDFSQQLSCCAELGIHCVELRGVNGKSFCDLDPHEAKQIAKQLREAGISVSAVASPFGKISIEAPFEEHLERMKRVLNLCNIVETERIRIFSFYIPEGRDPIDYRPVVFDRLDQMGDECLKAGIFCCHENEKGIYGNTASNTFDILNTFSDKIVGVFDPANFVQCGENALEAWHLLSPYINYLHIKDATADGTVVPAGQGDGSLAEIISDYLFDENDRLITLEPHLWDFEGLAALEQNGETAANRKAVYAGPREAFRAASEALSALLNNINIA